MKLKNKIALVTGSSRGIGRATALLFAKEGATVIVNYEKSAGAANEVVKAITRDGGKALAVQCDVSNEQQVKAMIDEVIKKFGRLDILVNNAGIVFDVPFEQRTVAQWKRTLAVNLIGTFLCAKFASEHMLKNGYGRIVNVSSTNGINSLSPFSMDYDASKAGVINLTKNLAEQLAPHILVNSVAPGWVDTDINKDLEKDYVASETKKISVGRFAQPEEIATPILFLASDDNTFTTGTTLVADGGYVAK